MRHLLAVVLALAPLGVQAETLSYTWTPRTAGEADALRAGLMLYSLRENLRNGGTVRQWGSDNFASLSQSGSGNFGTVLQRGDGHDAILEQNGGGNAHAIIQAGRGAEAEVVQRGGEIGATIQLGY